MGKAKISQGKFKVILREEEEGDYSVQCLELPGTISEGDTKEEALKNIREAIQGYLEAFPEEVERLKLKKRSGEGYPLR
ncbi:MAG: type II toxin-antitoxin system HicB family antitoxin [Nitrososphaerales archaeon]